MTGLKSGPKKDDAEAKRDSFVISILNALNANISVLDRHGNIIYVNEAWKDFARENGDSELKTTGDGVNYLSVCRKASPEDTFAGRVLEGIEAVINGSTPHFTLEYPCDSPAEKRWFLMFVTPLDPEIGGVVVAHNDITARKLAEEALKKANDDLEKRVKERTKALAKSNKDLQDALSQIEKLKDRLQKENVYLREEIKLEHNFEDIIGTSDTLKEVLFKVEQVAPTDATVLILGETGTGKELIARAVHNAGSRKDRSLVKVNCATLPSNLIESELFGHEKGAFTGAQSKQIGRFELADGGTIFLDEIGELPLELQAKLLRVLQDGEFERLGNSRTFRVDVRVIAATNRNLKEEVEKSRFREDLWYRLNVFPITVPPLRERRDDIPPLVSAFVRKFAKKMGREIIEIHQDVMESLQDYSWPGNVRELENVIERAVILSRGSALALEMPQKSAPPGHPNGTLEEMERDYITQTFQGVGWRIEGKTGAAGIPGINVGD